MYTGRGPGRERGQGRGWEWEEAGCWSDRSWEQRNHLSPLISRVTFSWPGQGCIPSKSLARTQVTQKQASNSHGSGFNSKSPGASRIACHGPGRIQGRPLTLSTNGPLPAFFADTGEGVAVDHTGASIVAGAWQAATVPGCKTREG